MLGLGEKELAQKLRYLDENWGFKRGRGIHRLVKGKNQVKERRKDGKKALKVIVCIALKI